jgi:hypothetical protein
VKQERKLFMVKDFATIDDVSAALAQSGPEVSKALVAAVEAAKRYIYAEGAQQRLSAPYQGPWGLTPTLLEFGALMQGLRNWAVGHHVTTDTTPLMIFRHAELSRCLQPQSHSVSGFISAGPLAPPSWVPAAQRAVEVLNDLKESALLPDDLAIAPGPSPCDRLRFEPGAFVLDGQRAALNGNALQVLRALAKAQQGVLLVDLQSLIWPDYLVCESTIRSTVSTARTALRRALVAQGLCDQDYDPIPLVDYGESRTAWRLQLPVATPLFDSTNI